MIKKNFVCYADGCMAQGFQSAYDLARHIAIHNDDAHRPYRVWALREMSKLRVNNPEVKAVGK